MTPHRSAPLPPARISRHHRHTPVKPPKPTGHPWWAYVLLVVVAVGALGLTVTALTHDYESAGVVTAVD